MVYNPNTNMGYGHMNPAYNQQLLDTSLKLVKEAVLGEKEDELFYDYLISIAPTQEEKEIIASIRDDEMKHNKMFRKIYKDFTGMDIDQEENVEFEKPKNYIDGISRALFGELKAVEKYREIRKGLPTRYYRDMLFEIITDELKHSTKYNYLYTKNMTHHENNTPRNNYGSRIRRKNHRPYSLNEWEKIIDPLVQKANHEPNDSKEIILASILVGSGYDPRSAMEIVEQWEGKKQSE